MSYREKVSATVTRITGRNPALAAWPVNSVFIGYTATSPATLLGGGTWVQISQGRMLMGQNPSDPTCDAVGDTAGARTHMQTVDEVATHNHYTGTLAANGSGAGHTHNVGLEFATTTTTGGTAVRVTDIDNTTGGTGTNATAVATSGGSSHTHGIDGNAGDRVGFTSQTAMDITNPFLTVYIWRRTA